MVVTWIVALEIIFVVQLATRNVKLVPEGIQNFVEFLVEVCTAFSAAWWHHMIHRTLVLATAFIFILFANWFGLIPGLGTIGWAEPGHHNEHITEPDARYERGFEHDTRHGDHFYGPVVVLEPD